MLMTGRTGPRYERSPSSDAGATFCLLYALYVAILPKRGKKDWQLLLECVWASSRVEPRGDYLLRKHQHQKDRAWDEAKVEAYISVGLGYCLDVVNATMAERDVAWSYAADAAECALIVMTRAKISAGASKAAGVRHAENRAMRRDAIAWYRANRNSGMTKDAAAERIAKTIVPAKFRTVRDWLSQEKD